MMLLTCLNTIFLPVNCQSNQIEAAVTSAYPDIHREILSDGFYRLGGAGLARVLRCCYDNLAGEIVLPCTVIMEYITPENPIDQLVFVSTADISR